jgi:hypothetical protein
VGRIELQHLALDIDRILHLLADAQDACRQVRWSRAIDRFDDARILSIRLAATDLLSDTEKDVLRIGEDEMRLVRRYIERNRLPTTATPLPDDKALKLDRLIANVARIQGRLRSEGWEVER